MKKDGERGDTAVSIDKRDLLLFNELRAREGGRIGENLTQGEFIGFLLYLYQESDSRILDKAWERTKISTQGVRK